MYGGEFIGEMNSLFPDPNLTRGAFQYIPLYKKKPKRIRVAPSPDEVYDIMKVTCGRVAQFKWLTAERPCSEGKSLARHGMGRICPPEIWAILTRICIL